MKRDMDLIRSILILVEDAPAGETVNDFSSLGAEEQFVFQHVVLAEEAGLLEARYAGGSLRPSAVIILRLTTGGHDFLAQARQPALWNRAKDTIAKAGVGITIEILKPVLSRLALGALGLSETP